MYCRTELLYKTWNRTNGGDSLSGTTVSNTDMEFIPLSYNIHKWLFTVVYF